MLTSSYQQELYQRAFKQSIPLYCTLELTVKCNLVCKHCYNFDRSKPMPDVADELSRDEVKHVMHELKELGCFFLTFSGGEPLLHPHLPEFIQYARKLSFVVDIKTNGIALTPKTIQLLKGVDLHAITVSMYGATSTSHDAFTGRKQSFEKALAGIQLARDAGFPMRISFVLHDKNSHEVAQMRALADKLQVSCDFSTQLTARYDGTRSSLRNRIDIDTLENLYRGPLRDQLTEGDVTPDKDLRCGCARTVCGISATGTVFPCIGAPIPAGNIRERSLKDIWRESQVMNWLRKLEMKDFKTCYTCSDRPYCRRNSGVVYANTGEYTGIEEWTCQEAAMVKRVKGVDV